MLGACGRRGPQACVAEARALQLNARSVRPCRNATRARSATVIPSARFLRSTDSAPEPCAAPCTGSGFYDPSTCRTAGHIPVGPMDGSATADFGQLGVALSFRERDLHSTESGTVVVPMAFGH